VEIAGALRALPIAVLDMSPTEEIGRFGIFAIGNRRLLQ